MNVLSVISVEPNALSLSLNADFETSLSTESVTEVDAEFCELRSLVTKSETIIFIIYYPLNYL